MAKLIYISHSIYLKHNTGLNHPEKAERLQAIKDTVHHHRISKDIAFIEAFRASDEIISLVHSNSYLLELKNAASENRWVLDGGDTVISEHSIEAAYFAVGATLLGIDLLKEEKARKIFCAVRPPGHHAEKGRAMGFCIFNNVSIAAKYAQSIGFKKILIVDWDVHHGNGTQHIFEKDNTVYYYSLHQYPFYPGTGSASEIGIAEGEGFTLNRPLAAGSADDEYITALKKDLEKIQNQFQSDLIIISAGFDAHKDDPLANMRVTEEGYGQMTNIVNDYANQHTQGMILSVLEGGYNLNALANSVIVHLDSLIKH
jgi:acetoin utilization deacetylase AcuC-like enzyme